MLVRLTLISFLAAASLSSTNAQFTCTAGNQDEKSCLDDKGDDGEHCAWCEIAGFGFCASEAQAEKMEENLPGTKCDRYSGSDDDATPSDDDSTPTDDNVAPNDDSLPDDFWTCLQKKTSSECSSAGCTWCDSKQYGFGLCMTGPTADSAASSDFFECSKPDEEKDEDDIDTTAVIANHADPMDTSCLEAMLQEPTEDGCKSAVDSEGNSCKFCSLQGVQLCLNEEQAKMGEQFGMACGEQTTALLRGKTTPKMQDPMDTACLLAFLQDPTEGGCKSAVDSDGDGCEFCSFQGVQLCLNGEQAQLGEQFGMECEEQALTTRNKDKILKMAQDPFDTSCLEEFLQDPTEEGCKAAVDSDGNACEFCSLQGTQLCLNQEQAQIGEQFGMDCDEVPTSINEGKLMLQDPADTSCLEAMLQDPTEDGCKSAVDSDGNACEFCSFQGVQLCLNEEQAEMGEQFGMECEEGEKTDENVELPPDFLECLENYEQHDCNTGGCTWCNTEVGIGFCMADAAARAMSECDFFSCDTRKVTMSVAME